MKISELIEQLKGLQDSHGDLDVFVSDPGCGCCSGDDEAAEADVIKREQKGYNRETGKPEVIREFYVCKIGR